MKRRFLVIGFLCVLTLMIGVGTLQWYNGLSSDASSNTKASITPPVFAAEAAVEPLAYIPLVMEDKPASGVFGMQINSVTQNGGLSYLDGTETRWIQTAGISWADVEPTPGARNWSAIADKEEQLVNAAQNRLQPVVVVRGTPDWAQKYANTPCGPMKAQYFDDFARFMRDLVNRYSKPPYNVKYWQIWNEADISPTLVDPDSPFGCWGDPNAPYYGGSFYGDMLKVVYPAMKSADSDAQVYTGGLLLDCDPEVRPSGKSCLPAKFLEGMLQNGGGQYFDGVSFHAYDYNTNGLGQYANSNWNSSWDTTGPVTLAKAGFIRDTLAAYGITNKALMNTEAAVLCDDPCSDSTFETTKAYYVVEEYAAAIADGLQANLWYSLSGWRNSGLVDNKATLPAYDAYVFAAKQLSEAGYMREITEYSGMRGYVFDRGDRHVWVLWSTTGNKTITLPKQPTASYDFRGNARTTNISTTVGRAPVYFELTP